MPIFNVYPKEGEMFSLEIHGFKLAGSGEDFDLYNDAKEISLEGFISLENVAAIVPESQHEKDCIQFGVYLKNNPSKKVPSFSVFAHAFDTDRSMVIFKYQGRDMRHDPRDAWPVPGLYIDLSEVVAIIPTDGLKSWRD